MAIFIVWRSFPQNHFLSLFKFGSCYILQKFIEFYILSLSLKFYRMVVVLHHCKCNMFSSFAVRYLFLKLKKKTDFNVFVLKQKHFYILLFLEKLVYIEIIILESHNQQMWQYYVFYLVLHYFIFYFIMFLSHI